MSSAILDVFPVKKPVTVSTLVAHRQLAPGGKVSMMWAVFLNGEYIGFIRRSDSKWVHDNWGYVLSAQHKADKALNTKVFELKILVWRAYKNKTADIVHHTPI